MKKIFNKKKLVGSKNPFEDKQVAKEWITSVENEKDLYRDKEIYPRLKKWLSSQKANIVVEIGSGQGVCSDKLGDFNGEYIGVEPSRFLTKRAIQLYGDKYRKFIVGDAYCLPIGSKKADAAFSVMVWFHLEDIDMASSELSRILKPNGEFMIMTTNPSAEKIWEASYFDFYKEGNAIIGKLNLPTSTISKSIFYQHSQENIEVALKNNDLEIENIEEFGLENGESLFLLVRGNKRKNNKN